MHGQWIGRYEGTNSGLGFIDIDDEVDHYSGVITVFDEDGLPGSFATLRTADKGKVHQLRLDVAPFDPVSGLFVPPSELEARFPDTAFPTHADVRLEIDGEVMKAEWETTIATSGTATLTRSQGSRPSELTADPTVKNWKEFKDFATSLPTGKFIFRGQSLPHRLRTSFHRTARKDLFRYMREDIPKLHQALSSRTRHLFNLEDPKQNGAFWNLIQHHGYPTPLLDWSYSPFVAAFFAFNFKHWRLSDSCKTVRVLMLDKESWSRLPQLQRIAPALPHFSILEALAIENERAIPQQAVSSITNLDDIETHIRGIEKESGQIFLRAFDLPCDEYRTVMGELALMNITAGALFPGLDGACEEWKTKLFGPGY